MSDDRGTRRRTAAALPKAAYPEAAPLDESMDGPFAEAEPVEDTVPYLPPLASYRIQIQITDVRPGVPHIYPDEILDEIPEEDE